MKKKRQTVFRLGLERVRELCRRLGDPQNSMHFVHVAGTNGKGSASVMLYEVLTGAGYVTGLYTSPFLVRENEEIRAAGREITDGELAAMRKIVREAAQGMEDLPTDFEETTALAFLYFNPHTTIPIITVLSLFRESVSSMMISFLFLVSSLKTPERNLFL